MVTKALKGAIGCHVPMHESAKSAEKLGADVVQIHLGSPQQWGQTKLPRGDVAENLYVHAPYLVNLSTYRPEVYKKSRETLLTQAYVAAEIDALGVVVHGGSWKKGDRDIALDQWESALSQRHETMVLIENSANGQHSLTRQLEDIADLWRVVGHYPWVGFCLDTAHLWANIKFKNQAAQWIIDLRKIVGEIQLVHANGSGAEMNSGVDRHSPLATSVADPAWVAWCAFMSQCTHVVAESTDPMPDMDYLRDFMVRSGC